MSANAVEIRVWMLRSGIKTRDAADALGVTAVAVNRFINGCMSSRRIRRFFLDKGCPPNLLPNDAEEAA